MKKLTKILLIKWLYFEKQLIEVKDINFLTGKNGAGKSTVIDALQIVLLGATNTRNFNKAANDSSQRTLDSYLRADMDPNSPKSRRGKDFSSYIACEFWDDQTGSRFTAGIVFDCRSDGSRRDQYFLYDGPIPESCYLVARRPMDIAALRIWLKALPNSHYEMFDSNKHYRETLLAKWNVHNEQVCRMLKKAVSFRPIVNIQDFITENICDIMDKPDIEAMQQNIREYKRHEAMARRQEEKLSQLNEIARRFGECQAAIDRRQLHQFLTLWAEKVVLEQRIEKLNKEKEDCTNGIAREQTHSKELDAAADEAESRRNQLIADRAQSDVYQEQTRLRGQRSQLEQEQRRLMEQINQTVLATKQEAVALTALCRKIEQWSELEQLSGLREIATVLQEGCAPLQNCGTEIFAGSIAPFAEAQTITTSFADQLRKAAYELEGEITQLQNDLEQHRATLEKLRKNIKDYPDGLLDLKNQLQTQLFPGIKSELTSKFWQMYWKLPTVRRLGAGLWRVI